jgi:hypothetical protein
MDYGILNRLKPLMLTTGIVSGAAALLPQESYAMDSDLILADIKTWFGIVELPFLFGAVLFGFLTAGVLRGGRFGTGMALIAWGSLVMGVGHIHMQADYLFHLNLFNNMFGKIAGSVVWVVALITAWALSGFGFYQIYSASKHVSQGR